MWSKLTRACQLVVVGGAACGVLVTLLMVGVHAEEANTRSKLNERVVRELSQIHLDAKTREEAAEEARRDLLDELCESGEVEGRKCEQ